MKRIHSLLYIVLALTACTGEMPEGYIVTQEALSAPATVILEPTPVQDTEVELKANTKWTVEVDEKDAEWFSVSPTEGSGDAVLRLWAGNHSDGTANRSTTFTVRTQNGLLQTVSVTQRRAGAWFVISSTDTQVVGEEGGTFSLLVNCNAAWSVTTDASWCRAEKGDIDEGMQTVTVTVDAAPDGGRSCQLVFKCENEQVSISVVQQGQTHYLTATPSATDTGRKGGACTVTVNSDVEWTLVSSHSWAKPGMTEGSGNATIQVEVEANPTAEARTAQLTFFCKRDNTLTCTCTITQEAGRAADPWDNITPED